MLQNSVRFNTAFGGVTPRASNAIYIHGELDPWRTVGVQTDDDNDSTTVIVIEGNPYSNMTLTLPVPVVYFVTRLQVHLKVMISDRLETRIQMPLQMLNKLLWKLLSVGSKVIFKAV